MAETIAALLTALDLEAVEPDRFRARAPATGWTRVFGGLVFAQALVAAARTAAGRPVHAAHGLFLLPGDPDQPFDLAVERLRDGGSFTARRCTASQRGRPVFTLLASFHAPEDGGFEHAARPPESPPPEVLSPPTDAPPAMRGFLRRHGAVELRAVDAGRFSGSAPRPGRDARQGRDAQAVWLRVAGALPDAPEIHAAALALLTDITLLDTALLAQGRSVFDADVQAASLDHAVWFHRPARADAWLLYAQDSPSAAGGRGFARGTLFDRGGRPVASTAQDGLVRRRCPA